MTEREVLKLALEALENLPALNWIPEKDMQVQEAIAAIKEALREHAMYEVQRLGQEIQPEQEPVAWMKKMFSPELGEFFDYKDGAFARETDCQGWTPLYTTPPQRTWVGLTDEDKKQIAKEANYNWEMTTGEYAERIGRLTEAKLKEKNT